MTRIEQHWYHPVMGWMIFLAPLAGVFALASILRRAAYRAGWLASIKLNVPVVVIGNIHVGGVGKTPLTVALTETLQARGIRVGVISRGYGGRHRAPTLVTKDASVQLVGDESLLLAATGAPVAVGRDRVATARHLLAQHPELDLILSDDGLQHYRLARDLELVVVDGARGMGNGWLLPNGPLREPLSRLDSVDAIVINGPERVHLALPRAIPTFSMRLEPGCCYRLDNPSVLRSARDFDGEKVVALAGIGHPERFFQTLQCVGIHAKHTLSFADHYPFTASDIPGDADAVIITAKDAVKLRQFNPGKLWVLPTKAQLVPDLAAWIIMRLRA